MRDDPCQIHNFVSNGCSIKDESICTVCLLSPTEIQNLREDKQ